MKKLGIYIHIPYCIRKCNYCDFVSFPLEDRQDELPVYFESLTGDIEKSSKIYGKEYSVDSVFFGGGTPSCVDAGRICGILERIRSCFNVEDGAEISLEANPGTLDRKKLSAYRAAGFNRISLGIQSFDDEVLRIMGRIHDSEKAAESFALAREYFGNINLDLILGTPGQDLKIWSETLSRAIDLGPEHISFYSLQLEEGTPFYEDYRSGRLDLPSWEENRAMYHRALELLKQAGYEHYEISNAARPGFRCRHNIKYWSMEDYLGLGCAASSFLDGRRFENGLYLPGDGRLLSRSELEGDFIFTQLRLTEGLDTDLYRSLFGSDFEAEHAAALSECVSRGLLAKHGYRIAFTEKGLDMTNPVMAEFLNDREDRVCPQNT